MPLDKYTPAPPDAVVVDTARIAAESARIRSGATWFWWIAGLSVINSAVAYSGGHISFVVGLGFTQAVDAIFQNLMIVAVGFNLFAIGFFVLVGLFARKGKQWAFLVGGIAYLCDGAIFLLTQDWLAVGFHAFALFGIFSGWKELRSLVQQAKAQPPAAAQSEALPAG